MCCSDQIDLCSVHPSDMEIAAAATTVLVSGMPCNQLQSLPVLHAFGHVGYLCMTGMHSKTHMANPGADEGKCWLDVHFHHWPDGTCMSSVPTLLQFFSNNRREPASLLNCQACRPYVVADKPGERHELSVPQRGIWGTASINGSNIDLYGLRCVLPVCVQGSHRQLSGVCATYA